LRTDRRPWSLALQCNDLII